MRVVLKLITSPEKAPAYLKGWEAAPVPAHVASEFTAVTTGDINSAMTFGMAGTKVDLKDIPISLVSHVENNYVPIAIRIVPLA